MTPVGTWLLRTLALTLALGACAPLPAPLPAPGPGPAGPAPEALYEAPRDSRTLARSFVTVVDAIEPVAERECRARSSQRNCDFRIVVDDRPGIPANAFQTEHDEFTVAEPETRVPGRAEAEQLLVPVMDAGDGFRRIIRHR